MTAVDPDLPYVDEHAATVAAGADRVWAALEGYVTASLASANRHPVARVLGASQPSGFEVVEAVPGERLRLAGSHRFARYSLVFDLGSRAPATTVLRATTYATFPGLHGRAYRALVIGTGGHALATRSIVRAVRRRAESPQR